MINPKFKLMYIGIINSFAFMLILYVYISILPSFIDLIIYSKILPIVFDEILYSDIFGIVIITIIIIIKVFIDYFRLKRVYLETKEDRGIKKRYFVLPILGGLLIFAIMVLVFFIGYWLDVYIPISIFITLCFPIYIVLKITNKLYLDFKQIYKPEFGHIILNEDEKITPRKIFFGSIFKKTSIIINLLVLILCLVASIIIILNLLLVILATISNEGGLYDFIVFIGYIYYFIIDSVITLISSIIIYNKLKVP